MPVVLPLTVPATMPALPLVALQLPPGDRSVRVILAPGQTAAGPEMVPARGKGLMVMDWLTVAVPQVLVTL